MSKIKLHRRGFDLGIANHVLKRQPSRQAELVDIDALNKSWSKGNAFKLEGIASSQIHAYQRAIDESHELYNFVLNKNEVDSLLAKPPYSERLAIRFEALGAAFNEGNKQEIETVFFDGIEVNGIVAEDLWVKVSWLSFYEADESIRFRFSFGVDFEEDVASDKLRQHHSAELAETIFQESKIVTKNEPLIKILKSLLKTDSIQFVERIVYFNAPNGGAYLHHDRERGHAGVAYAQISGSTFWLTLPRSKLVSQIQQFVRGCINTPPYWPNSIARPMREELSDLASNDNQLVDELESFSNASIIQLINETEPFVQSLIAQGYGTTMTAGDVLLLPQESEDLCCWHSVFCTSDEAGQALSFAIRDD